MSAEKHTIHPAVKWAGGKRQLLDRILPLVPEHDTYYEPFVGGGAVFLALAPEKAVINDSNEELVNVYRVIRDNPEELIALLKEHRDRNSKDYYYEVREQDRVFEQYAEMSPAARAARILYLNRTCFNGLYRVNRAGEFNVPWGRYKNPQIVDEQNIRDMSAYLNRAKVKILCQDYRETFRGIRKDSFVYLDPPYMPISQTSSFTGYTAAGFGEIQHAELKKQCDLLNRRGIRFLLSNSNSEFVKKLYREYTIEEVEASRSVNAKGDGRGNVTELLIRNY